MATVALLTPTSGTNPNVSTTGGNMTVVGTPTAGDLIVVVCQSTGVQPGAPSDNNADGFGSGYTNTFATFSRVRIDVRDRLIGSGTSTTWTSSMVGSSGGAIAVYVIQGHSNADGVAAGSYIGKTGYTSFIAGATPTATLSGTTTVGNPLIGAISNNTNTATMTPPGSWTETYDSGYNTPTTGCEGATLAAGAAVSSVAWGSTSISAGNVNVAEILTGVTAPAAAPVINMGGRSVAYNQQFDQLDTIPQENAEELWGADISRMVSRIILPNVPAGVGGQSVNISLIDQSGLLFGITENVTANIALIDQSYVVFALGKVNQTAALGLIDQTGTIFALSQVNVSHSVSLIDQSGTLFALTPAPGNKNVSIGFIDQSGTLFAVVPRNSVAEALIDQTGTIFTLGTPTQQIHLGLIDQSGVVFAASPSGGAAPDQRVLWEAWRRQYIQHLITCGDITHRHYPWNPNDPFFIEPGT